MSFSPREDDGAVLAAALAFLDDVEDSPLLLDDGTDAEGPGGGEDGAGAARDERPKRGRRRQEAAADVLRRKRRKDERLALLREKQVLEQRLALLRRNNIGSGPAAPALLSDRAALTVSNGSEQEWKRRALTEAHASVAARDVNQKLKLTLKRQQMLLAATRNALARAQPKAQSLGMQSQLNVNDLSQVDKDSITALKRLTIEQYDSLDRVIAPVPISTELVSNNLAIKMDPVRGPYSEHTTTTVAPKELGVAAALIEENLLQLSPPCAALEIFVEMSPSDMGLGFEKQYTIRLHSPGRIVPMSGAGFIRIYREPERVVVLWSTRLDHAMGVRFHEQCWFVVARSPTRPSTQSVARSCYRFEMEKSSNSWNSEEHEDICNFIQFKLTSRMRCKIETIQAKLLEKTSGGNTLTRTASHARALET